MKYCTHCGKEVNDNAVICTGCGCPINQTVQQTAVNSNSPISTNQLVSSLSQKLLIGGIIWVVIGTLQLIIAFYLTRTIEYYCCQYLMFVGLANLLFGIVDLANNKIMLADHTVILSKINSIAQPIISLVYTIVFIFYAYLGLPSYNTFYEERVIFYLSFVIGIIGSIYYFVAIIGYINSNKTEFKRTVSKIKGE